MIVYQDESSVLCNRFQEDILAMCLASSPNQNNAEFSKQGMRKRSNAHDRKTGYMLLTGQSVYSPWTTGRRELH